MSLEDALNETTAAIKELSLIMATIKGTPAAETSEKKTAKTVTKEYKDGTKATGTATLPDKSPLEQDAETGGTPTSDDAGAESTELDYNTDVVPVVTAVAKKFGRDGALEVLKPFNVTSARELDKSKWQELIDACKAKVAEE